MQVCVAVVTHWQLYIPQWGTKPSPVHHPSQCWSYVCGSAFRQ